MSDIIIKTANHMDKEQLIELFKHYRDKKIIKNRVECYLSHNNTVIAKSGKKIIGIIQWLVKEDPNNGIVEFEELFVNEKYRNRGVGYNLVKYSIKMVKKFFDSAKIKGKSIYLFVNESNQIARKLYERLGFEYIANLGNIFSENESELVYYLDIKIFEL
ncbi:MAG: GNAT family N-acetyltransferase [Promethearchaeota archaeon]